jgi:hypothetical protein
VLTVQTESEYESVVAHRMAHDFQWSAYRCIYVSCPTFLGWKLARKTARFGNHEGLVEGSDAASERSQAQVGRAYEAFWLRLGDEETVLVDDRLH